MTKELIEIFSDRVTAIAALLSLILIMGWISLMLYFIGKFFLNRKLSIGKFSTAPVSNRDDRVNERSHENCPKVADFYIIMDLHREHTKMTIELMSSQSIIAEQKKYARDLSVRLVNAAEKRFRELLIKQNLLNIIFSKEYTTFIRYVDDVRRYCFELFVEACEENHFAKKTDKAFEDYLKTKVANIVDETVAYSFKILPDIFHNFEGYQEAMKGLYEEVTQSIELSLRTARDLSISKKNEMDIIDESFFLKQKKIISGEYPNELPV